MGWARMYIDRLKRGETVSFRPRGNSMRPRLESGQLVTCAPVKLEELTAGDIVLCTVNGAEYLHYVRATAPGRAQIANARGHINGWTSKVFGRVTKIE